MNKRLVAKGLPKYYQISQELIAQINKGEFSVGTQIPSENEIINKYKVSNTTARKVLQEIEKAGWVNRIKGKGTFVSPTSVNRSLNRILSFTKNMVEQGRKPSTKVVSVNIHRRGCSLTLRGRRYNLKGPICEIQRIRFADGVPMMKETRYISSTLCPGIERMKLERSLYDIYHQKYNITLEKISQILSVVFLDQKDYASFNVTEAIPAFKVKGVTFCGKELIVEIEESIYRGDLYRFYVDAV